MTKMLLKMKIVLIFSFISVIWFLPEKISAQKLQSSESAFVKIVESILASSCLRKKKFGIKIHSLKREWIFIPNFFFRKQENLG